MSKATNWLTVKQAAQETGYHPEYIRKLCREGKVTFTKIGRAYLVEPSSLRAYKAEMDRLGTGKHSYYSV